MRTYELIFTAQAISFRIPCFDRCDNARTCISSMLVRKPIHGLKSVKSRWIFKEFIYVSSTDDEGFFADFFMLLLEPKVKNLRSTP